MDIVLFFSGLFSAVSTSFIVAMESNLRPDPSDTTNALLKQLVQMGLDNLAEVGSMPADPASTWSSAARIQMAAYASLSMSLLAAFGVVLGKQWLGYYKSNRYGRGSQEERGKRRQENFHGRITWYFEAVVQSFPVPLQISLLLFGIVLGANIWYEQSSIAWVIIATTVFRFLFYSLTVVSKRVSCCFQQLTTSLHSVLQRLLGIIRSRWSRLSELFRGPVHTVGTFARQYLRQLFTTFHNWLRCVVPRFSTKPMNPEAQLPYLNLDISSEDECALTLPVIPRATSDLDAPSIKWLLETSTDPEVFLAAASLVPQVE